jgi:DNA-binding NarL/FixJ family response regulator
VRSPVDLSRPRGLEPIRVLIVDAERADREELVEVLDAERDIEVSCAVADGRAAIGLVDVFDPNVVVIDLQLSNGAGIRATQILSQREPPPSVLAVTAAATDELALDAIRAGAAGLCEKGSSAALADAVRGVASGHAIVAPGALRDLVERVPPGNIALNDCTPREREVMALIAEGATNPEVCRRLHISDATVRTHVANLRRKLRARTRAELVARAYGLGGEHGSEAGIAR